MAETVKEASDRIVGSQHHNSAFSILFTQTFLTHFVIFRLVVKLWFLLVSAFSCYLPSAYFSWPSKVREREGSGRQIKTSVQDHQLSWFCLKTYVLWFCCRRNVNADVTRFAVVSIRSSFFSVWNNRGLIDTCISTCFKVPAEAS